MLTASEIKQCEQFEQAYGPICCNIYEPPALYVGNEPALTQYITKEDHKKINVKELLIFLGLEKLIKD